MNTIRQIRRRMPRWLAVLAAVLCAPPALSGEIPFGDAELFYEFDGQPLQSFFEGFFSEQGLSVSMSPGVAGQRGTLNGPRRGSPEDLFDGISRSNQVLAYFDGSVVHLYKPQEQVSRYFTVGRAKASKFRRLYGDLNLGNRHNSVNISAGNGVVAATGAPYFVEQVAQLIGAIGSEPITMPNAENTLRYFPLRYAFASDTTIYVGRRETVVPGVATLLRQAVTGRGGVGSIVVPQEPRGGARRLRGKGLAAERPPREGNGSFPEQFAERYADQYTEQAGTYALSAAAPPAASDGPYIVADSMHNAILIRDKPARMAMYQNLIEILDIEPALVEIVATVIDLDRKKLKRTGVDLRLRGTDAAVSFGDPSPVQDLINANVSSAIDLIPALSGLTSSVIVGDTISFSARLNALDDRNLAKVVSSPQIITLNDMEAVIQSNREVFIPVGGSFEVDLFDVIAGTTLRVTPHVINDGGRRRIRIATAIEDGDVQLVTSSVQKAELPIVDRNIITTQAIIDDGQSLLIGGLRRTTEIKRKRGVPFLRNIPVVKHAFSNAQNQRDAAERLFLITPRLVGRQQVLELREDADMIEEQFDDELEQF
ncbi:MAG: type III secretion system outer membrane ring subunit SctC [Gammaproteobacteria bacterium]